MLEHEIFEVPSPRFSLTLAEYDRRFIGIHSRRILCFALPPKFDPQHTAVILKKAFDLTVRKRPFLAGNLVKLPKERGGAPWTRDLVPEGSAKLVIKDLSDAIDFDHLRESNFNQSLLDDSQLSPFDKSAHDDEESFDACRFQANFVKGGLLLTICIAHILCDGVGITEIIKTFAESTRQVTTTMNSTVQQGASTDDLEAYALDRNDLMTGYGLPGSLEKHLGWMEHFVPQPAPKNGGVDVCKTFAISMAALADLKQIASSSQPASASEGQKQVSTHDSILALLWRSILLARHKAGIVDLTQDQARIWFPLDFRSLLKFPDPFHGNAVYCCQVEVGFERFANSRAEAALASAAAVVRANINSVDEDLIRDFLDYINRTSRILNGQPSIFQYLNTSGTFITSYWGLDHFGLDFGPLLGGHIQAFRLPVKGVFNGLTIILPRMPGGGCEIMISEREDTMRCLMNDPFFSRFAVECA